MMKAVPLLPVVLVLGALVACERTDVDVVGQQPAGEAPGDGPGDDDDDDDGDDDGDGPVIDGGGEGCPPGPLAVEPLFQTTPDVAPVVETIGDGTIVTRAAGRVRGRHENEVSFNPYLERYFEKRSYAFVIEDRVAAGESSVKVTYLPGHPVSELGSKTNFRFWKIYGNGNVFVSNVDMEKISPTELEYVITQNTRDQRPMQVGDLLEFEIGIFIAGNNPGDPEAIEGRTAYYTDTFRYRVGVGGLTDENLDPSVGVLGPFDDRSRPGAATTIPFISLTTNEDFFYYSQMALNVQQPTVQKFLEGRRLFHTDFATGVHTEPNNPNLEVHTAKAGPLLNQTHCSSCHVHNGPGVPPAEGEPLSSMVVKLFGEGDDDNGLALPHPSYGRQLQDRSVGGATAEGKASILWEEIAGQFDDGTPFTLRRPQVVFADLSAGPVDRFSLRLARRLPGLGLLEAIDEATILGRADPDDCDGDGISGRPNVIVDPTSQARRLGRFGWKAAKGSVAHQVAEALNVDMGVTTEAFPLHECPAGDATCATAGAAEVSAADLERLVTYSRTLGVPPRRNVDDPAVLRGEELFHGIGCVGCHAADIVTGNNHPSAEFHGQAISPYTDLLLHDMGDDLADTSDHDGVAGPSEWRTPPLWGIGLVDEVLCRPIPAPPGYEGECLDAGYLHDGRARTPIEAVLWHGGEAQFARDAILGITADDRAALSAFLESL